MRLPIEVGDYVDFYSSFEHATNLGRLFRPTPGNRCCRTGVGFRSAITAARATIVIDGTPIVRPSRATQGRPTRRARVRAAARCWTSSWRSASLRGLETRSGMPIAVARRLRTYFGLVLVNDWSARDIQAWEYQPLGPFLGKSFATTISPWVVTLDALEPFRVAGPPQEPAPLPYLRGGEPWAYDIALAVELRTQRDARASGDAPRRYRGPTFRVHVLEHGAAAGARDGQRRGRRARATCMPRERFSGSAPDSSGQPDRAHVARRASDRAARRRDARHFSRTATRVALRGWCEKPGARPTSAFGCARSGAVVPASARVTDA